MSLPNDNQNQNYNLKRKLIRTTHTLLTKETENGTQSSLKRMPNIMQCSYLPNSLDYSLLDSNIFLNISS